MSQRDRGFASMDRSKQREIASKGGKAAHQKGTAHEWTSEEARDASRKGGIARGVQVGRRIALVDDVASGGGFIFDEDDSHISGRGMVSETTLWEDA